jgi:integrase
MGSGGRRDRAEVGGESPHGAVAGGSARSPGRALLRVQRQHEELVFGRTPETPFVPSTIDNHAQECWSALELDLLTMHEARHTFASLLIDAGTNPKAVQEFMGHANITETFDTYGHLFPGSRDEVRQRMDAYLLDAVEDEFEVSEDAA